MSNQSVSNTTFIFWIRKLHNAEICSWSMETGSTQKNMPPFVHHKAFCVTDINTCFVLRSLFLWMETQSRKMFFSNSVVMDIVEMNIGVKQLFPPKHLWQTSETRHDKGYCVLVFVYSFESCLLYSCACRGWGLGRGGLLGAQCRSGQAFICYYSFYLFLLFYCHYCIFNAMWLYL